MSAGELEAGVGGGEVDGSLTLSRDIRRACQVQAVRQAFSPHFTNTKPFRFGYQFHSC